MASITSFQPLNTPVLIVIFNRPETTKIVLEEIRRARPLRPYIAADGPCSHVPTNKEQSDKAKEIIHSADWRCELKSLFREENLGCGRGVSSAISWFLVL